MAEDKDLVEASNSGGAVSKVRLGTESSLNVQSTESENAKVSPTVVFRGRERSAGRFVIKRFRHEVLWGKNLKEGFLKNYEFLKDKGFPVPLTVRGVDGKNEVLVTDLSNGGEYEVFSQNEMMYHPERIPSRIENLEEVKQKILDLADKADALDLAFGGDVYFFIVDKKGNAEVVLGDLGINVGPRGVGTQQDFSRERALALLEHLK
ncbi:MAG: hypothetical protein Q7S79_03255 [bacterium]|nr:hypothetical protein [bacterium]